MKNVSDFDQLKKYANDLAEMYKSDKKKGKQLEAARKQLLKCADRLKMVFMRLRESNDKLKESYLDTIQRLVLAAEYKDEETGDHIIRMSRYCALIAEKLGLPQTIVQDIYYAAPMHDVGKIGIPDSILMKPGKLTDEEFEIIKTHTKIGAKILAGSKAEVLQVAKEIAISHHEQWNGRGYPFGLSGNKIPLVGRIVGLADVFDAITSRRPYKEPSPVREAYDIIRVDAGQHFDPTVVDVFLKNFDEIIKIKADVDFQEKFSLSGFIWQKKYKRKKEGGKK